MARKLLFLGLIVLLFSSCATRRLVYLQDPEAGDEEQEFQIDDVNYQLQPHDILYVSVTSFDQELTALFNQGRGGGTGRISNTNNSSNMLRGGGGSKGRFYFSGYTISDSGYIDLPIVGKVNVGGMTVPEAKSHIKELVLEYLEEADVIVKMVSFDVTFFGEFGSPGTQSFFQERLNIYEAITRAGGITQYGDRERVFIVRQVEGRKKFKTLRVNLNDRDILEREELFLRPNDMVYVEPLPTKRIRVDINNLFFYISTVTSLITSTALVISLSK